MKRLIAWSIVFLVVGGASGWALSVILAPRVDIVAEDPFITVKTADGEVGESLNLAAKAKWAKVPGGTNRSAGTVTSIDIASGEKVEAGKVIYTVNLRPVSIALGKIPSFRPITLNDEGSDVQQLQTFLAAEGVYSGVADGKVGSLTLHAIRTWQKSRDLVVDGVFQAGDVLYVPELPTRVALDTEIIYPGASLVGGESAVATFGSTPSFTLPLTEAQSATIVMGSEVEIQSGNDIWQAVASSREPGEPGAVEVTLLGADGGSICGDSCDELDVLTDSLLPCKVTTLKTVQGVTVPSAALNSNSTGGVFLTTSAGEKIDVRVVVSARGLSVIEGARDGLDVRISPSGDRG